MLNFKWYTKTNFQFMNMVIQLLTEIRIAAT